MVVSAVLGSIDLLGGFTLGRELSCNEFGEVHLGILLCQRELGIGDLGINDRLHGNVSPELHLHFGGAASDGYSNGIGNGYILVLLGQGSFLLTGHEEAVLFGDIRSSDQLFLEIALQRADSSLSIVVGHGVDRLGAGSCSEGRSAFIVYIQSNLALSLQDPAVEDVDVEVADFVSSVTALGSLEAARVL